MALIPTFCPDCVVAIGFADQTGGKRWAASGFLLGRFLREIDEKKEYDVYLVTNRHVLAGQKVMFLRFNPQGSQPAQEYTLRLAGETGKQLWYCPRNAEIDVAVTPIDIGLLQKHGMQVSFFQGDTHIADRAKLSELGVSEGDFIYVLGFPMGLVGGERNYVIVRSGTIARIRDALGGCSYEFLVDAFIFPGNSGGPVLIKPEVVAIEGTLGLSAAYLIGIVNAYLPYNDVALSAQTGLQRVVFQENSGLASVVPIDFVLESIQVCEQALCEQALKALRTESIETAHFLQDDCCNHKAGEKAN